MSATEGAGQMVFAAGAATFFSAAFGLDLATVTWALVGSVFGALFSSAPEGMGGIKLRLYLLASFVGSVLLSAQWASAAGHYLVLQGIMPRKSADVATYLLASTFSILFPMLLNIIKARVPKLFEALLDKAAAKLGVSRDCCP